MQHNIKLNIHGVAPLILHNAQTTDPLNHFAQELKKINGKRIKTEDDHAAMARIEFLAGLYVNSNEEIIVPAEMLEAMIVAGAKRHRKGPDAKAGLFVERDALLVYPNPRSPEELLADKSFVLRSRCTIQKSSIMRTRPIFREWSCEFSITYLPDVLNREQVIEFVETAGRLCGIGTWRPRHGRFVITAINGKTVRDAKTAA